MQINRRFKGRKDNMRLINGEHGFTGAQYANTAKGTKKRNNAAFGSTGTFTAKEKIECNEEILIDYDGNSDNGKYWDVWGEKTGVGEGGEVSGTPLPLPPPPSPPQVHNDDGRPHCGGDPRPGKQRAIRRGRVHALKARASASVVNELARRVNRFERGEGGGVT